jgi:hypothetical protein
VIRWEDPPTRYYSPKYDWPAIAKALSSAPGTWALVAVCRNTATAGSTARHIRNGAYGPLRAVGKFEAIARTVRGEARVYARYVGSNREEPCHG